MEMSTENSILTNYHQYIVAFLWSSKDQQSRTKQELIYLVYIGDMRADRNGADGRNSVMRSDCNKVCSHIPARLTHSTTSHSLL